MKSETVETATKIRNFRDLEIWKLGKEIVIDIYHLIKDFPKEEVYGLSAQIKRASVSIPSNIAEGFNRFHNREYRQFLYIALGSCAEVETQIDICFDLNYINFVAKENLLEKLNHEQRMLRNLIKKL